jgi:PAS domain S-box-containing protein
MDYAVGTMARGKIRAVLGYCLAVVLVALALIATLHLKPLLGESISPLFFAAVMLSAWYGGPGPGLLATLLAGWASSHYFPDNPPGRSGFSWDDGIRLAVFLMVATLISSLTSLRKRAQEALQRSLNEMEMRVQRRTAELRSSNEQLRQSEEQFRVLIDGVNDYAIVMLDPAGNVLSWSGGAGRIEGYREEEVVGQHVSRFFTPEDVESGEPMRQLRIATAAGRHEDEGLRVRKDGTRFLANVITTLLRDERGDPRGFAQITRDVTELRNLESRILDVSESERRRIGHDLHDGLGQQLTGLALLTQSIAGKLSSRSAVEADAAIRIVSMINEAIEQVRDLARGLAPVELGPDGLRAAVKNMAGRMDGVGGVSCRFESNGDVELDEATSLHLYRVAQEAMNNAIRHGHATVIDFSLMNTVTGGMLSIKDNGSGIQPGSSDGEGIGIQVMNYRAKMIGAMLEVSSIPGGGTLVSCAWPRRLAGKNLR